MSIVHRRIAVGILGIASGLGCSSSSTGPGAVDSDAGAAPDAGEDTDTETDANAASPQDAGGSDAVPDASPQKDAGAPRDAAPAIDPNAKRVFITSAVFDADLKTAGGGTSGVDGADKLCASAAAGASLGGTWVAWISATGGANAIDRVKDVSPWYLVDRSTVVFVTKANITQTGPLVPITMDESGASSNHDVWTGTTAKGALNPGFDCSAWTRNNAGGAEGEIGLPILAQMWTEGPTHTCDMTSALYCFEQ